MSTIQVSHDQLGHCSKHPAGCPWPEKRERSAYSEAIEYCESDVPRSASVGIRYSIRYALSIDVTDDYRR